MSKLVDRLENLSKGTIEPIGFKAAVKQNKGIPMLLMAALPKLDGQLVEKIGKAADAILVPVADLDKELGSLKSVAETAKECTLGVWLKGKKPITDLKELGVDFVIFEPENMAASMLQIEEIGKIVEVLPTIAEGLGSAIEDLPIDAVLMSSSDSFISVHQMMTFRWMADLVGKPLLIVLTGDLSAEDLSSLWDVGVQGVVIPVKVASDKDKLLELRKSLSAMPVKRTGSKMSPLLPRLSSTASSFDEEDEGE